MLWKKKNKMQIWKKEEKNKKNILIKNYLKKEG